MKSTVGRTGELARARDHLSNDPGGSVLFVGPPGIGKSTVLAATAKLAGSLGYEVRRCRAAAPEEGLPYVGLHDLIGDALGQAPVSLPEPLRRALEVVLLRADPPEGGLDVLAVNLAVLEVIEMLASRHRVALVLDDVQWLDRPTRRVLGFALHRRTPGRVAVLAAARRMSRPTEELVPEPALLIEIGPLTQTEIADLVERRTGLVLSPRRAEALCRLSGGNPFLALELTRERSSAVRGLEQFPVPERHLQVLGPRLSALPATARRAVLAAALSSRPTTAVLTNVAGSEGVAAAESAGVLHVSGAFVEIDHPLLGAAARHLAGAMAQREMHLALAAASHDPIDRARHLALGTVGEDAPLADELEAAAGLAADRAAIGVAAELCRDALDHTPVDAVQDRARRAVAAARWFHQCGERDDASAVIAPTLEAVPAGPMRARCLIGLADALGQDITGALALLREALDQPGLEPEINLEARMQRAGVLFMAGNLEAARVEAARAGAAASEAGAADLARAIAMVEALADLCLGVPLELSEAWGRTQPWPSGRPVYDHPNRLLAYAARGRDDQHRARDLFEGLVRLAQDKGDLGSEARLAMHLTEVAIRDGRLTEAAAWAERSWHGLHDHSSLYPRAHVAAWTGELDTARQQARATLKMAVAAGDAIFEALSLLVLGFTEVSARRLEEASLYESRLRDLMARVGWGHPGLMPRWQGDAVEAFLGTGRLQEAADLTSLLWHAAERLDLPGCQGLAAHCDGLIQSRAGDLKLAEQHFERALSLMSRVDMPLERARTLLALGVVRRRRRQRAAAQDALTEAHAVFTNAGARVWAGRADEELRRASAGRAGEELSRGERSVAELAAAGRTNREIAVQLYLSPKTVETMLTHVYRKLGVRSRTELSRTLGPDVRRGTVGPG
ncbi:MAG TPA: LuxR family transcriptional regulator [Intrasporangium sp.]|nr:LuxR family transcriptional regulator [Intrasporangium sp.]